MATRLTYLANIFHQAASGIGYIYVSGQGTGGIWINPNKYGIQFSWRVKWPADIVRQLVRFNNLGGTITNSDL